MYAVVLCIFLLCIVCMVVLCSHVGSDCCIAMCIYRAGFSLFAVVRPKIWTGLQLTDVLLYS